MKKALVVILAIAIVFLCSSAALAAGPITKEQYYARAALAGNELKYYDDLYALLIQNRDGLSIDGYGLSEERAFQIAQFVYNDSPELYNHGGDYTNEEIAVLDKRLQEKSDEILMLIDDGMSDIDKFKAIYIYLGKHSIIDFDAEKNKTGKSRELSEAQTIIGGLINGKTASGGMAHSLQYILYQAGIHCYCVTGSGHMWNIVQLDDNWYYTDATQYNTIVGMDPQNKMLMDDSFLAYYSLEPDKNNPPLPACKTKYEGGLLAMPAHTEIDLQSSATGSLAATPQPTDEAAIEEAQKDIWNGAWHNRVFWYFLGVLAFLGVIWMRKKNTPK